MCLVNSWYNFIVFSGITVQMYLTDSRVSSPRITFKAEGLNMSE